MHELTAERATDERIEAVAVENPFAPGLPAAPEDFVGREREAELIFGHISAVQRGSVAVSGALGMGKTSLLRFVADPEVAAQYGAAPPDPTILYVDIQSVTPFSAIRFWQRVARLLERDVSPGLEAPIARLLERGDLDIVDLEEFLDALADQRCSLVLLLDEFEWALQADSPASEAESRNLLAQLASLMRRTPRVLSLVTATEAPLPTAAQVIESWRGSPFATLFTSVTLKPLTRGESDALVDHALSHVGVSFDATEKERLHRISGGAPAALQAAAFALFHGRAHGVEGRRLWESVESAAHQAFEPAQAEGAPVERAPDFVPAATDGSVRVDRASGEVVIGGRRIESLTALEYNLLECLYAQPGRLRTKEDIVREVWGEELADDTRVEKLISRLRRKIEPVPERPQYIRTVRGRGYRLVV